MLAFFAQLNSGLLRLVGSNAIGNSELIVHISVCSYG